MLGLHSTFSVPRTTVCCILGHSKPSGGDGARRSGSALEGSLGRLLRFGKHQPGPMAGSTLL
ncbi:hypothetical protein M407DRAFT_192350 [Tulasnella calospora MUT 4182]|uniref:Uncharacterized protein n=1 Tax=Tulasnella calospora MUT 4182 TaxID=1051891 RepID=A0A0C3QV90_9AGAM|nr:hypothetical protein M407DRAFT_192350 [Tulasnella calospora MUT 4182]